MQHVGICAYVDISTLLFSLKPHLSTYVSFRGKHYQNDVDSLLLLHHGSCDTDLDLPDAAIEWYIEILKRNLGDHWRDFYPIDLVGGMGFYIDTNLRPIWRLENE